MKHLLPILIAVIFLNRGVPAKDARAIEVIFDSSHETVLVIFGEDDGREYHNVAAGTYTFYRELECEVQ